jgi:hypothetical protein
LSVDTVHTRPLKSCSSQITAQTPRRVVLKLYRYTSSSNNNYTVINLPSVFIEELSIDEDVTAEIITTSDGRRGILILGK